MNLRKVLVAAGCVAALLIYLLSRVPGCGLTPALVINASGQDTAHVEFINNDTTVWKGVLGRGFLRRLDIPTPYSGSLKIRVALTDGTSLEASDYVSSIDIGFLYLIRREEIIVDYYNERLLFHVDPDGEWYEAMEVADLIILGGSCLVRSGLGFLYYIGREAVTFPFNKSRQT